MCHNMIGVDVTFDNFRKKIWMEVWCRDLFFILAYLPQLVLSKFLYYKELIANRCNRLD